VRETILSATVLALALTGDALLYVVLPVHAGDFGVDIALVGILLSANRLIRIVGYGSVMALAERIGARRLSIVAVVASVLTTLTYGLGSGFWLLLAARIGWGLAFAALNLTALVYAASVRDSAGRSVGVSGAIRGMGPTLALAGGAALVPWTGPQGIFVLLGCLTLLALPLALALPKVEGQVRSRNRSIFPRPSSLDIMAFVVSLCIDGIFVITLTLLLKDLVSVESAVLSAGMVLALKGVIHIVLAPVGGSLGDRFGASRLMALVLAVLVLGLCLIALAADRWPMLLVAGMVLVACMRAMLQILVLVVASRRRPDDTMRSFSTLATWSDIGAAIGPLVAAFAFAAIRTDLLYLGMAAAIAATAAADHLGRRGANVR
jgi:predicted MFS family arabinose efflux permease